MSRRQMLYLGQKALELVVERFESLSGEIFWEGEFQQGLEDQLSEDPPEDGRLAGGGDREGCATFYRSRRVTTIPASSGSSRHRRHGGRLLRGARPLVACCHHL